MNDTVTIKQSGFDYPETVHRLREAIGASGATIFAVIDQAKAAEGAGLTLRPTTLILFGNPKGGTPVMDRWPLAGLALPLRLLVWDDGEVNVAFPHMEPALSELGVPVGEPHVAAMSAAVESAVLAIRG